MNNVGGKLRGLAVIIIILGVILSIILFVDYKDYGALSGILALVGGLLVTLAFGFLLYGLGQIVENTDEIAEHFRRVNKAEEKEDSEAEKLRRDNELREARSALRSDSVPQDARIGVTCMGCGARLSYTKAELLDGVELTCPECGGSIDTLKMR